MTPRRRIYPVFVPHAGCPNNCVFCNQKRISGSLFPVSAESVGKELSALPDGAGYELAFYGGSFTAIPASEQESLLAAAQPARERGAVAAIRVSTRPDAIDENALVRLKKYGVVTIELGAQSMIDSVLLASARGHTSEDTVKAAGLVKAFGFQLILQMMTGLPESSPKLDTETAEQIITLRPDGVRIYPTVVVRDTSLESMWRSGAYVEHTVEDAVELCAELLPLFSSAGIPVIRLGLNPSDELSEGGAVGGAYHPALGELVRSRILRRKAEELLSRVPPGSNVSLSVTPGELSAMIGQHRENVRYLQERFSLGSLRVVSEGEETGKKQDHAGTLVLAIHVSAPFGAE